MKDKHTTESTSSKPSKAVSIEAMQRNGPLEPIKFEVMGSKEAPAKTTMIAIEMDIGTFQECLKEMQSAIDKYMNED